MDRMDGMERGVVECPGLVRDWLIKGHGDGDGAIILVKLVEKGIGVNQSYWHGSRTF